MKPEYVESIRQIILTERLCYHESQRDTLTDKDICRNKCVPFTMKLVDLHPELERQAGFVHHKKYHDMGYKGNEHWWCVSPEGQIIDPSAAQFGSDNGDGVTLVYTKFDPLTHKIVIGKCMNCGWDIYGLEAEGPLSVCRTGVDGDTDQDCQAELERAYG